MPIEYRGKAPQVDSSACVAPTAVCAAVRAAVRIGADDRFLFAVLAAEDGEIRVAVADLDGDRECCGGLPG